MKLPSGSALADMAVGEFAGLAAQSIVRAGGQAQDTAGVAIYGRRLDVRIPVQVFDPVEGRTVRAWAKIRITVERE